MSLALIYALIFGAVLLIVDGLLRWLFGARQRAREVNDRLARLAAGGDQMAAYNSLLIDRSLQQGEGGISEWYMRMYRQSGLTLSVRRRIAYVIVTGLACFLFASWMVPDILLQIPLAVILTAAVVTMLLLQIRARRIAAFVRQLPPALEIIVRSLNAGHPLTAAIALVGREMPDPIGSEFGILSDQLTFGAELDAAMLNMIDRVGADELNLVAVTVSVQRGTGGNLGEILENLSGMIRDRAMLRQKIRAISAEGRMTAVVMTVFPFGLYFLIRLLMPTYFDPLWESGSGTIVLSIVGTMMVIGILVLRRMVRFDF
jgi:tight adherence protein B